MEQFLDELNADMIHALSKNYLLFDIKQREFFAKHTKKATKSDSAGSFDDEAIQEIINSYFDNFLVVLKNRKLANVNIGHVYNGDISVVCNMPKCDVLDRVFDMYQNGNLSNLTNIDSKIQKLQNIADLSKQQFGDYFNLGIDNKKVQFETNFLKAVILSAGKSIDFANKTLKISGLTRDEFCYVLKRFIGDNNIQSNYVLSSESKMFIDNIVNDKLANTAHFNRFLHTNDKNLMDVVLNDDLKNYVYSNMPQNYSDLEKAIFVYIKLCKLLTYDPEFYANNQSGMVARQHEDITRLGTISTQETRVVCYEFAQLYSKFLYDLGINYDIDGGFSYGDGHADVKFRAGEFIVNADSVTSIIGGDMYNAKINGELEGLKCENINSSTLKKFDSAYDRVYNDIIKTEDIKESDEGQFYDFLDMFDALCEKEHVTIDKKTKIYEKRCKEIQLPTMDKMTYMLTLSKAIFEEEISKDQFSATIVSQKEFEGFKIRTMPIIVYAFNSTSFKLYPNQTTYMMMDKNGDLKEVSKQTLLQNFSSGALRHITTGVRNKHKIPGIDTEVENVK